MPRSPLFPPRADRSGGDGRGSCTFGKRAELTLVFPAPFHADGGWYVLTTCRRSGSNAGQ